MKCAHCHRPMRQPWVITAGGPVGPKCGRRLGIERPRMPKEPALRVRVQRSRDSRQVDWVQEMAA